MCRLTEAAELLTREARERWDELERAHDGEIPKLARKLVSQIEVLASNARALARRIGT